EIGLIAAGLVAISPLHVHNSTLVTTDIWVAIFSTLILLYCAKLFQKSETKYYFVSGIFVGLGTASKYPGVVFSSAVVLAHLVSQGLLLRNLFSPQFVRSRSYSGIHFLCYYALCNYRCG